MNPYPGGVFGGMLVFIGFLFRSHSSTGGGELLRWLLWATVVGVLFTLLLKLPRPRMTWKLGIPYIVLSAGFGMCARTSVHGERAERQPLPEGRLRLD